MENIEVRNVYELNENLAQGFREAVESNQTRKAFEYVAELFNELYIHLGIVEEVEESQTIAPEVIVKKIRRTVMEQPTPAEKPKTKSTKTE